MYGQIKDEDQSGGVKEERGERREEEMVSKGENVQE